MYSTCLFCTKDLGKNEVIETLPVGRRIAFDTAQGRLWVVCRHCAKWNLVPFDTRLESIEAGERLFRNTTMRYSTDNIGLARVKEGLELVRIGPALRPEFAAWRYGDQFGRRRRRALLAAAGVGAVAGGIALGGVVAGVSLLTLPGVVQMSATMLYARQTVVRVPRRDEKPLVVTAWRAESSQLQRLSDGNWGVRARVDWRRVFGIRTSIEAQEAGVVVGRDAEQMLAGILAYANRWSSGGKQVQDAVSLVEQRPTMNDLVGELRMTAKQTFRPAIAQLGKPWRIAAEMLLHEKSERTALEGELAMLEWQWKEADRLAKISDSLALE